MTWQKEPDGSYSCGPVTVDCVPWTGWHVYVDGKEIEVDHACRFDTPEYAMQVVDRDVKRRAALGLPPLGKKITTAEARELALGIARRADEARIQAAEEESKRGIAVDVMDEIDRLRGRLVNAANSLSQYAESLRRMVTHIENDCKWLREEAKKGTTA